MSRSPARRRQQSGSATPGGYGDDETGLHAGQAEDSAPGTRPQYRSEIIYKTGGRGKGVRTSNPDSEIKGLGQRPDGLKPSMLRLLNDNIAQPAGGSPSFDHLPRGLTQDLEGGVAASSSGAYPDVVEDAGVAVLSQHAPVHGG